MAKHSIHSILAYFRQEASSNRDLGDRFERLVCRYLELDPIYAERFSRVWLWNEWPQKGHVGDVGIDIVAEERAMPGEFCAIQCKFYLPECRVVFKRGLLRAIKSGQVCAIKSGLVV